MVKLSDLEYDLQRAKNSERAIILSGYFKTGKREYGEGDVFLGITVPQLRQIARKYLSVNFSQLSTLLKSKIHEYRLTALFILVGKYSKGKLPERKKIVDFYLKNTLHINNWDLVDSSASYILGSYFSSTNKSVIYQLAKSKNLWERRMAIVATYQFIKNNKFEDTLKIAQIFLSDKEDLIHKATGWMLREVGKRDQEIVEEFLRKYYQTMPRTMLRYAIEKFSSSQKKFYLNKK
ncbi:DNA alkylation repair protein [Candidatus Microgenomates bacterium]|nr:DNA alkylation repair protein [Candidatus Microgenomates bacterium]